MELDAVLEEFIRHYQAKPELGERVIHEYSDLLETKFEALAESHALSKQIEELETSMRRVDKGDRLFFEYAEQRRQSLLSDLRSKK